MRAALLAGLLLLPCAAPALTPPPKCPVPRKLYFRVEKETRRDRPGFTEGLEFHDGAVLESTGDFYGDTGINRIDLDTGRITVLRNDGKSFFGEGLTLFDNRLYQLTWREHRVLVSDYDGGRLRPLPELTNPREGWGLTHDATHLIASDGSSRLFFLSPKDFSTRRVLRVIRGGSYVYNLNELEYAQGSIWANVFESWEVVRISPVSGCVEASVNLKPLRFRFNEADRRFLDSDDNFIPNGIAFDPATGRFTLTGKYWPLLFSGHFVEE
jgi:glutamine cyclotransferase